MSGKCRERLISKIHTGMVSVENFYWVLYENLGKPVGLDFWYYFPFGTLSNLSRMEFKPNQIQHGDQKGGDLEHHVLFHFDQEPISGPWLGDLYDIGQLAWNNRLCRILANSEISDLKKAVCKQRGMLDWYFFYHGFAALHWFNDCQYMRDETRPTVVFNSFNHLVRHKRSYRMALTARFIDLGIAELGDISFHGTYHDCLAEITDANTELAVQEQDLISKTLTKHKLPLSLDRYPINGDSSAYCGVHTYRLWQKALWHVVNETVFYDSKLHLTEKIFKPVVCSRPFILVAAPGNLAYLRSYGFMTFSRWIDESYDDEPDYSKRLDMIAHEVQKLCALSPQQLNQMHQDMKETLNYNKQHFFGDFKRIIIDEMVDNFDTCIRLWNNGRVDGRDVPNHPSLSDAKKNLNR